MDGNRRTQTAAGINQHALSIAFADDVGANEAGQS
jgi:hypothetical protein